MTKDPPPVVYRVVRGPPAEVWAPWRLSSQNERFDDPQKKYRVLYASSQRIGCFIELLYPFRVGATPGLADVEYASDNRIGPGKVPTQWALDRVIGSAKIQGRFADVGRSEWVSKFRQSFDIGLLNSFGLDDFDLSILLQSKYRQITQLISRQVYEEGYDGIYYVSKHGTDIENWALFCGRASISALDVMPLESRDPDYNRAIEILNLTP